jgi:hypothetical protein
MDGSMNPVEVANSRPLDDKCNVLVPWGDNDPETRLLIAVREILDLGRGAGLCENALARVLSYSLDRIEGP